MARNLRRPLAPTSRAEMRVRGWDWVDVVFVTGDAYVDHPSFAMAILHRVLDAAGFRVAMLSQPDWHSCEPWRQFRQAPAFLRHQRRQHGLASSTITPPTRKSATTTPTPPAARSACAPTGPRSPNCHRAREAFPACRSSPAASRRRSDAWPISTTGAKPVRARYYSDAKADAVVYGMGEKTIVDIAQRLAAGQTVRDCATCAASPTRWRQREHRVRSPKR